MGLGKSIAETCTLLMLGFLTGVSCFNTPPPAPPNLPPAVPGLGTQSSDPRPPTKWTKQMIPNPRNHPESCGRGMTRTWVCDPNSLLSSGDADMIDSAIEKVKEDTGPCPCRNCDEGDGGYSIGVAVITRMETLPFMPSTEEKLKEASEYAEYIRDISWSLGSCNDDIIIFLALNDRIVYTATGSAVSDIVTDHCVDEITDENKHYLTEGTLGTGLRKMVEEYGEALMKKHNCNSGLSKGAIIAISVLSAIVGSTCCCVCVFLMKKGSCKGGGGGGGSSSRGATDWGWGGGGGGGSDCGGSGGGGAEF